MVDCPDVQLGESTVQDVEVGFDYLPVELGGFDADLHYLLDREPLVDLETVQRGVLGDLTQKVHQHLVDLQGVLVEGVVGSWVLSAQSVGIRELLHQPIEPLDP